MQTILFFGLGSVAKVMSQCLAELSKNSPVEIVFIARNRTKALEQLKEFSGNLMNAKVYELSDFMHPEMLPMDLGMSVTVVNTTSPDFNKTLLEFATARKYNYCDLASDIYEGQALKTHMFPQLDFDTKLVENGNFALINVGISPGVTDFIATEMIEAAKMQNKSITEVKFSLLEHLDSDGYIPSWSPATALEEYAATPYDYENGMWVEVNKGVHGMQKFTSLEKEVTVGPLFQEEALSIARAYPDIKKVDMFAGGSEIETVTKYIEAGKTDELSRICHSSVCQLAKLKDMSIHAAAFEAIIEVSTGMEHSKVSIRYILDKRLSEGAYAGATYVSYPTGVGGAVLLYISLMQSGLAGVIDATTLSQRVSKETHTQFITLLKEYGIEVMMVK